MKNHYIIFAVLLFSALFAANTVQAITVVYPTGIFPADVQNVQAAINQGGTVLRKATDSVGHPLAFNFGTPEPNNVPLRFVAIETNVSLSGELVSGSRTTITGGFGPLRIFGGKNSIDGIKIDGPLNAAIVIVKSNGTRIIGNAIQNVVPDVVAQGFSISDGIDVFGGFDGSRISGDLVISGNSIGNLTGDFALGIQVDSVQASVTISNNTFQLGQTAATVGFLNSAGIGCVRCHKAVTISGNMITIGPGIVFNGIVTVGGPDARYHVYSNTINSQGPLSDGIVVFGVADDPGPTVSAVIENNFITVHNAENFFGGIDLFGAVSSSTTQGNIIRGDAGAALNMDQLFPGDTGLVSSNRFLFNDIASVTVSGVPIFLGANTVNNLVRGQCVDVIDLGVSNDISCPNPASHVASFSNATRQQLLQRAIKAESTVRSLASQKFSRF